MLFSSTLFRFGVGLLASVPAVLSAATGHSNGTYLELTTLVTKNGASAFECWRLADAFTTSTGAGTAGARTLLIDNLANATYTVIPPRFEGGVHNAPHAQLVSFLSGVIHITLPTDPSANAWIKGGIDGTILAFDTTGSGHDTSYPSDIETRGLQIPFDEGRIPDHVKLHNGPCHAHTSVVSL